MMPMRSGQRTMTALRGGTPDRVPCFPHNIRWLRHHYRCTCPHHQLKLAEEFGFDAIVNYGQYVWNSLSNDYCYSPCGGFGYSPLGLYGDLPDVKVEMRVENRSDQVWYHRTFHTPAGTIRDVIQWPRPDIGYGDGPNPHRVEPLIKTREDLDCLSFLYPEPRRDLLADIPLLLEDIGDRAVVAASDNTHIGGWGLEVLGVEDRLIFSLREPAILQRVCRLTQDVHLRNLRAMLERGIRVVFDSWFQAGPSNGWSPKTFKELFLPLIRETVQLAHEYDAIYIYQDDGKMARIIPDLVEAGIDVLSGLQPPPVGDVVLGDVKKQYGDRVALMGGLDPTYAFDLGSPDRVTTAVRQALTDAAAGGGYILAAAEAPGPETAAACFHAGVRAVREYGAYQR